MSQMASWVLSLPVHPSLGGPPGSESGKGCRGGSQSGTWSHSQRHRAAIWWGGDAAGASIPIGHYQDLPHALRVMTGHINQAEASRDHPGRPASTSARTSSRPAILWRGPRGTSTVVSGQRTVSWACHRTTDEGAPTIPSFHAKSQVLEIHKHEKQFKISHNRSLTRWKFIKDLF
jgi:hypothetical protein